MIRFVLVVFLCWGNFSFAQQGQVTPPSQPAPSQGVSNQFPPPSESQMPNVGNSIPFSSAVSDTLGGASPVGLPPSPEDVMGKVAEGLSARDPFRLPEELIIKIRQKNAATMTSGMGGGIDPTVEAIRRFPLASYQLVGIIWDVKKPKAMFMDLSRSIHVVQVNDFIGNARGVITSIQSGAVTVLEGKIPQIIKLKK